MTSNSIIRSSSSEPTEEPTERAYLGIRVSRGDSTFDFGLKVPERDGGMLVAASVGVGGPTATLLTAQATGLASGWAYGLAAAQLVFAGLLALRPRRRRPKQ